jgi:hypothetical protein
MLTMSGKCSANLLFFFLLFVVGVYQFSWLQFAIGVMACLYVLAMGFLLASKNKDKLNAVLVNWLSQLFKYLILGLLAVLASGACNYFMRYS